MKEFDYDIGKYIEYRKRTRYEAKNDKIECIEEKYKGKELSKNAKKCIHDIERRIDNGKN